MNLLEHYVTDILSEPYYNDYGSGNFKWWVKVKSNCYGQETESDLMFDTLDEALEVKIGYMYLA